MSKCIKCGRELISGEIPEFNYGMCDKCYKDYQCKQYPFKKGIYDMQEEIKQLKQQLAEKDIRIEELECQFAYECECNMQLVDLQKQLEEKQKTIDEINKEFVQAVHDWKALCKKKDKEIEMLKHTLNLYNLRHKGSVLPNVNQLAIQELEKVKEEFGLKSGWSSETDMCFDLEQFIKQQIKELKGQHND